jgi:DNA-binding PadR family transcriptional regulator
MPRRRPGSLLPLEVSILAACLDAGEAGSHGFALARAIADAGDTRELTATGTLYRALHRLDEAGLVENWWEDPNDAAEAGRPRRRCYRITGAGVTALANARADAPDTAALSGLDSGFAT